jgi:uncharacterized Fe-S cluster-containing radical SAM superfamily enzyme
LKKEYNGKLRMIMKTGFNVKNKITAIGALAVAVLRYGVGITNLRFWCCAFRCVYGSVVSGN